MRDGNPSNLRGRLRGLRLRGSTVEETLVGNPVTGELLPLRYRHLTLLDPRTGAVAILEQHPIVQCRMGDVIPGGDSLAFCALCGWPVCTAHSVTDPFCGRVLCLLHSVPIDVAGIPLRVCPDCNARLREGWLRRMIRILLGRKT